MDSARKDLYKILFYCVYFDNFSGCLLYNNENDSEQRNLTFLTTWL